MRSDIPDFPSSSRSSPGRTASIINFFLGIWVLISPFVLGFVRFRYELWNNVIVGVIIMIVAGTRAWASRNEIPGISWINFIMGLWLIASAFYFGFRMFPIYVWNNVILGIAVAIIDIVSALAQPSAEPPVSS